MTKLALKIIDEKDAGTPMTTKQVKSITRTRTRTRTRNRTHTRTRNRNRTRT